MENAVGVASAGLRLVLHVSGPFVQLSLRSGADALHTLAAVERCQVHL